MEGVQSYLNGSGAQEADTMCLQRDRSQSKTGEMGLGRAKFNLPGRLPDLVAACSQAVFPN